VTVNCSSSSGEGLMTVEEIHGAVIRAVEEKIPNLRRKD
jgi:hypothetical protein